MTQQEKSSSKHTFLKNNAIVFILINFGSLFTYLTQALLGRALTPEDFGAFNSLNSLVLLLVTPTALLPLVLSRFTVRLEQDSRAKVRSLFRFCVVASMIGMVVASSLCFLFSGALARFLNIYDESYLQLTALYLGCGMLLYAPSGILQGLQRFMGFGITRGGPTVIRFLLVGLLVSLFGMGIKGALWAAIIATVASFFVSMFFLRDLATGSREPLEQGFFKEMLTYTIPVAISSGLVSAIGNLDLVMVRHLCSATDSGIYATAAILGRVAFFLPAMLIWVLFPEAAKNADAGTDGRSSLWKSIGLTFALSGGFCLVVFLFPELVLRVAFGPGYAGAATALQLVAAAMMLLAVGRVLFTYCLAHYMFGYLWIMGGGLLSLVGLVSLFHETPAQTAAMLLISMAGVTVASFIWFQSKLRKKATTV